MIKIKKTLVWFLFLSPLLNFGTSHIYTGITDSAKYYVDNGMDQYSKGDYTKAQVSFSKAISFNKKESIAYAFRSLSYLKLNDYASAQADMNSAIQLDSLDPEIINLRGEYYLETDKFNLALQDFNYVLNKDTSNAYSYMNVSKALLMTGKYKEGLDDITIYLSKGGVLTSEVKYYRSLLQLNLGDVTTAAKGFDQLIIAGYELGLSYLYRGICYKNQGAYSKALWQFENVEKNNVGKQAPLLYESKGQVLQEMQNYSAAIIEYTKLIQILPEYGQAYLSRGQSQMELMKYSEVISDVKNALRFPTDNAQSETAVNLLALAYVFTDSLDSAWKVLNSISFQDTANKMQAGIMKSITLIGKKDFNNALNECNTLLKENSSNPVFLKYRAVIQIALQNYSAAVDDLIKIIELYPNVPEAYFTLSSTMAGKNLVVYKNALMNNLVLYKDKYSNTVTVGFRLDDAHSLEMLDKLLKAVNSKNKLKGKQEYYLLRADFTKTLSKDKIAALNEYNKAVSENVGSGIAYYLRGIYKRDYLNDSQHGCADINKAKSLGFKTEDCQ